jgi:acetoacetate decarboxylase
MASPVLTVDNTDTLLGTLDYVSVRVATGTMAYKYDELDKATVKSNMEKTPNYLLKLIPHVDGTPRICELVRYYLTDVEVKAAYTGPATLQLFDHVMAPVSKLPVLEIVKTSHIIANLTLALGEVAVDYIADAQARLDSNFQ